MPNVTQPVYGVTAPRTSRSVDVSLTTVTITRGPAAQSPTQNQVWPRIERFVNATPQA